MDSMARGRLILRGAAVAYIGVYVFVLLVAYVTSGAGLFSGPVAWYAAITPLAYAAMCVLWTIGRLHRMSRRTVVLLHALSLPAVAVSFLGLGLLLPLLTLLWWRAAGKPRWRRTEAV